MLPEKRKRLIRLDTSGELKFSGVASEFEAVGFAFKHLSPANRDRVKDGLKKGIIPILPYDGQPKIECVEGNWTAYGYKNPEEAVGNFVTLNDYVLGEIVNEILETCPNPLWDVLNKIKSEVEKNG